MKRVLVVDDEAEFREFIVRFARGLGFEATAVGSGAEFRAVYDEIAPDVIVLDIVMPDEDGLELLSWLGAKGCAARVLIVTGYNPHYRETAEVLGGGAGVGCRHASKTPGTRRSGGGSRIGPRLHGRSSRAAGTGRQGHLCEEERGKSA